MVDHNIRFCTTSDGVRIAYATYGSGYPFVWVPGWISHLEVDWPLWQAWVEQWANEYGYMIVRYDKRGTGLSDRHQDDLSVEARIRDLEGVVGALKLKQFALYGISEGGPIAIAYAAAHPRRVSHLVLQGTTASGAITDPETAEALRALIRAQWGLATSTFTEMLLPDATAEQRRLFARLQIEGADVDDAVHSVEAVFAIDVRPLLPKIAAPTLVIHGTHDTAIPFERGRELAAGIRGARLFSFEGGHTTSDPATEDRITAAMREFLGGAAGAGPGRAPHRAATATPGTLSRAPSLATVLFTDLVGHTEMMQRLGDAKGRDVLREHERITRETLKQHAGAEIKTMGDGFLASFGSVTSAMECAIALQRAFAAHTESMPEPLRVRVGLNAGEPIEEDGDLFGATVILASRIAAQADAGEILIPEPVRHLLSGKPFVYADRGEFVPKGFDDAVRLYEVRWKEDA
jgi:class 3 adenylate cyclase